MNFEIQYQIANFLHQEAYLLDHQKYKEWLSLFTENMIYRMPIRVNVDRSEPNLSDEMTFFEEDLKSLTTRVNRLYAKSAWVEETPPRQRHFVSNIMIEPGSGPNVYKVRSYFDFKRSIGSYAEAENLFGEREDKIIRVDDEWKIDSRTIYPDQAVLSTRNLSMFL